MEEERKKLVEQVLDLKSRDPFADPDHASDNAAVDTDVREQVGHDTIEAEVKDLERREIDIDVVLKRIGKGNYGYCEKCNEQIAYPRLKLVPEARYCIECKNKISK